MRDVIHAGRRGLLDRHAVGDVAGDGHAEPVRLGADRLDDRRRDEAVDLDLLEAGVVILRDRLLRLFRRRRVVDAERVGAAAVDEAGRDDARTERAPGRDRVAQRHVMNSNSFPMSRTVVTPAAR